MYEIPPNLLNKELYKKALGNLMKRKEYHIAPPTKK